jgi:hypothetical protein
MSYIDPTPPGAPQPEVQPAAVPQPEIEPGEVPEEMPPVDPGIDNDNDSRPIDQTVPH